MTGVLLTLHAGTSSIITADDTSKSDIAAYLIRHSLNNPGDTSSYLEDEIISFRKLEARYGYDKNQLAVQFALKLNEAINRYYPKDGIIVSIDTFTISDLKYGLTINIVNSNSESIISNGIIEISDDSVKLNL